MLALLERGAASRATAATRLNAASSRSHAIFTLRLTQYLPVRRGEAQLLVEGAAEDICENGIPGGHVARECGTEAR